VLLYFVLLILFVSNSSAGRNIPQLKLTEGKPSKYELFLDLDPTSETFYGEVVIGLNLENPTRDLWLHGSDLNIEEATITFSGEERKARVTKQTDDFLRLKWSGKVQGNGSLTIRYSGSIEQETPQGLFHREKSDIDYLYTQFEAESARAMVPCFDQPEYKVPWSITVRVPDGNDAYSNTPLLNAVNDGDYTIFEFAETLPLPTYLISVAVGPFDVVDGGIAGRNDTPIRFLVPKGESDQVDWAIQTTGAILEWQEEYFDQPYPYKKLDVVSIPNLIGFAAMEHPGLITFTERLLSVPEETDTLGRRRSYVSVQAHELAHQWFGNLVTMAWWDDIWLNEGFASWMADKTTAALYPAWNREYSQLSAREAAMRADSLTTARQIRQPIETQADIEMSFDSITYSKGQAVLQMFETWLGEDKFQQGLRDYMKTYAHGTASTNDFLQALEQATGQPVTDSFSSFLDQPGLPLINMTLDCTDKPKVLLEQQRYLPSEPEAQGLWMVPICIRGSHPTPSCIVMTEATATIKLPDETCPEGIVPNVNSAGYYRSALAPDSVRALLSRDDLTGVERVGVIGDTAALITSGQLPPAIILEQIESLVALEQVQITRSTLRIVGNLDDNLISDDIRSQYQLFIRSTYGPMAYSLGFDTKEGESEEMSMLRPTLLSIVGQQGNDLDIQAEAKERVPEILNSGTGVAPEALSVTLRLAAISGDLDMFNTLRSALETTDNPKLRTSILTALASIPDPQAVQATLEWALEDELPLSERGALLGPPFGSRDTLPIAWSFMKENLDEVTGAIPAPFRRYIIYMASGFCDIEARDEVIEVFKKPASRWLGGTKTLGEVTERIDVCITTTAQQKPGVEQFFQNWSPPPEPSEEPQNESPSETDEPIESTEE
jgi:cytosol alanyl aminopeptidase